MKLFALRRGGPWVSGVALAGACIALGYGVAHRGSVAKEGPLCEGEYADNLVGLTSRGREVERGPASGYTYLVRSTARYECPYFGADGKLRRKRVSAVEHATAFAYEATGDETFLLTNEHLVDWPEVTEAAHKVEGVPDGCKRVEQHLRVVHDEREDEDAAQLALTLVATDPTLDAALLKAGGKHTALPYRIGRSAALRQGNAVQVRGFPLGLMAAVNTGKIVNTYDRDQEQGWDHVDFVIDALLSEGNSGSPVLALSCKTGELELVGMYHAGYKGASALNVVVGIDQLRELMTKKRRVPRVAVDAAETTFGPAARALVTERLRAGALPFFELGDRVVAVEPMADGFRYHVYSRRFPLDDARTLAIDDVLGGDGLPRLTKIAVWGEAGARTYAVAALGADDQELVARAGEALRVQLVRTIEHRVATTTARGGAAAAGEARRKAREVERALERTAARNRELVQALLELAERLAPLRDGAPVASGRTPSEPSAPPPPTIDPSRAVSGNVAP